MPEVIEATPATPAEPAVPATPSVPSTPINKPGFQTSEFWGTVAATVVPALVTILVWLNVVPDNIQTTLADSMLATINGLITIIAIWKYIGSRKEIKIVRMQLEEGMKVNNRQFMIQLYERGLISPEFIHKEFSVPRSMALSPKNPR